MNHARYKIKLSICETGKQFYQPNEKLLFTSMEIFSQNSINEKIIGRGNEREIYDRKNADEGNTRFPKMHPKTEQQPNTIISMVNTIYW